MSGQPPPPSPMPPQPQPFRFWLPYRSNVPLSRQWPRPWPASAQAQPPPPPTLAQVAPQTAPTSTTEQEIPIQSDPGNEPDPIPIQTLDSLQESKPSRLDLELELSRPPPTEQGQSSNGDNHGNATKISISGFPRARLFDGRRAPYRREIEDGLKSLAVHESLPGRDQACRIITLAGHNVGASMVLGSRDAPRNAEPEAPCASRPTVAANVNSNVQSVNNSAMEASTCHAGDPGVHMDVKNIKHEEPAVVTKREEKPKEPVRRPPLVVEPRNSRASAETTRPVRRRCLRALMMESESDAEGPPKPRRHGCRFSCGEKKERDMEDQAPLATASNGGGSGSRNAVEGGKQSTS